MSILNIKILLIDIQDNNLYVNLYISNYSSVF